MALASSDSLLSADVGRQLSRRNQAEFQSSVSADSDFQHRALFDLSRALAIPEEVNGSLMGTAGAPSPDGYSRQEMFFAELPISNRESPLSGPLPDPPEFHAEGSTGALQAGEAMPGTVAPGDVADEADPRWNLRPRTLELEDKA